MLFRSEVQNVRTELAPSKWFTYGATKTSSDTVKISLIAATLSGVGAKFDSFHANFGHTHEKSAVIGFKLDVAGLKVENAMTEVATGDFRGGKWALKVWL